jgi:hypothetical protein
MHVDPAAEKLAQTVSVCSWLIAQHLSSWSVVWKCEFKQQTSFIPSF